MNIIKWFLPVREIEFFVDGSLESCLAQIEDYQRYESSFAVSLRPKIELESIKNGEIYALRAEDKVNFSSLLLRLERREDITMASGYVRFKVAYVLMIMLLIGLIFYPMILSLHDVPLICLFFPVVLWAWIWFTYAMKRSQLLRYVHNILKDATIRKRH